MQETRFNIRSSTPITSQNITFSSLEKNTRYVIDFYRVSAPNTPLIRRCFKTRGEYTNAEQNLSPDGSRPVGDGRFGCFTVARTQQDIRDCLCGERRASTSDPWTNVLGNSYRASLGCSSS
ncbi:MAG: hypothetical protein OXF20_04105 [Gammaproteobacteria bacterium]|nr:hypothetical protein [Gammaproteobacteria bacterium]